MRTMMAWWRTGLSQVSIGVALGKLFSEEDTQAEGLVFVVVGTALGFLAVARYQYVVHVLETGRTTISRPMILATTTIVLVGYALLVYFRSLHAPK